MNKYYQMGWDAYKHGEDRWPMSHGLDPESHEGETFLRGYDAAATKATNAALSAALNDTRQHAWAA